MGREADLAASAEHSPSPSRSSSSTAQTPRSCTRWTPARSTRCRPACASPRGGRPSASATSPTSTRSFPARAPQTHDGGGAAEPVTMMEYDAAIAYRIPITPNVERAEAAGKEGRFLGLRCPICSRTYTGGRGFCPIDAIELTPEHEVDLPQTGVRHQLHDHHAHAVPGADGDRAVLPGARVARRHRRGARLPDPASTCRTRTSASACG